MYHDQVAEFEASLIGRGCVIGRRECDWIFELPESVCLAVSAPWRIVCDGRIAFASEDDGQIFGLNSPLDGELAARKLLGSKPITEARLDRVTADLELHFSGGTRIDVFNNSSGYEGWQASYAIDGKGWSLIAMGGGKVAFIAA